MGNLADAIRSDQTGSRPCKTCDLYDSLDAGDADELAAAIADRQVTAKGLARAIKAAYDFDLSDDVVRKHRHGECERWNAARG